MKKGFLAVLLAAIALNCFAKGEMDAVIEKGLLVSAIHSKLMAKSLEQQKGLLPRTIDKEGKLITSDSKWWTSGFFPGVLWYLYEATGDTLLKQYARNYTSRIEQEKYNKGNHDVGFMLYCSFGNGYRLTGDENYKQVLLTGAQSLSTRYKNQIGVIRSWDFNKAVWQYPVIIDNMMNLELLEWATQKSNNSRYAEIARSHADVTLKNQFRSDYSCWHVVSYDTITGQPEKKHTRQGYSHESSWSRGEAWALYGYVMMYRETQQKHYLEHAKGIANYILTHPRMPKDGIPYWDFDAPDIPNAYRDASAGAVMASAFIELSTMIDGKLSRECLAMAETQLKTLTSVQYLAEPGTNGHFILKHSVGSLMEKSEVDVPLTYADYYYVEALLRYRKLNRTTPRGYQVADWLHFKTSAVTYTFDDNSAKQFTVAQPLFDYYNYKVTFFVITSKITNWDNCTNASNRGHEVASHTIHHKNMSEMELTEQEKELKGSQELIRSKIESADCITLAYPNCALSNRNTTGKYYIAARSCAGKIVPKTPMDFYRISSISTGRYSDSYVQAAEQFNEKVNAARDSKGWCVFLTHCIDDEKGYSPTESNAIASHLEYIHENENSFWVAPFAQVVKYIRERDAVNVQERAIGGDSYCIMVTDTLPDAVYNVPLTIRREMPADWKNALLSQNGNLVSFTISEISGQRYFVFNVIPDSGDVILSKATSLGISNGDRLNDNRLKAMPNPFSEQMSLTVRGSFCYSVYNLSGKVMERGSGTDLVKVGRYLPAGIYLLKVDSGRESYQTKIIKQIS